MNIDTSLARFLVARQFPQWRDLPIRDVPESGWDNKTFRLGDKLLVRMPSAAQYAGQVVKEYEWLPKLRLLLPLAIPMPFALGEPSSEYAWPWGIYQWLPGQSLASTRIVNLALLAAQLADFLNALHKIDAANGPQPGPENFYRGGKLLHYTSQVEQAIGVLANRIDGTKISGIWDFALRTEWRNKAVWVHGDVSAGNMLVVNGRLSSIIDFGQLAVGDPACDLVATWTLFQGDSRREFQKAPRCQEGTWARARGWALWKALIVAAGLVRTNTVELERCWTVIDNVMAED